MSTIPRIVPTRGAKEERALFHDLPSGDARWRERTKHALEYLRMAPDGTARSSDEMRTWAARTGFGWPETQQQLDWLVLEGLAEGCARNGWRAKGA